MDTETYIPTNTIDDTIDDSITGQKEASPEPISEGLHPTAIAAVEQTFGEPKPRYFVMLVGGGVPTRQHRSRFWAEREAKRLCAKFPDKEFLVLKVKSAFKASSHQIACAQAITNLTIGQQVAISPFHYRYANKRGEITGFTPNGCVEVRLEDGPTRAFAATSLIVAGEQAIVGTIEQATAA